MYEVAQFAEPRLRVQHDLIRSHPLGLLICRDRDSGLTANPLPFVVDPDDTELGTLLGHMARPNPQWELLASGETGDKKDHAECLVVFQGPQAYVSPNWYPSKQDHGKVVPTWNYATVHAWGRPQVVRDPRWIRQQIDALTRQQEADQPQPWQVDDAPPDFTAAMLQGVVGIRIPISRIEGKWKVSQNRPQADIEGVYRGLTGCGREDVAALVKSRRPAS